MVTCACCGHSKNLDDPYRAFTWKTWFSSDSSINLPFPPKDLTGSDICPSCYIQGATMELRIRVRQSLIGKALPYTIPPGSITSILKKGGSPALSKGYGYDMGARGTSTTKVTGIIMPDKSDGYNCIGCQNFFSYVEPNCSAGYKCFNCRS
jgi:hypothetical protein